MIAVIVRRCDRLGELYQGEVTVPSGVGMAMDPATVSVQCVYGHSRR